MKLLLANAADHRSPGPYEIQHDVDGVDDFFYIVSTANDEHVASILYWRDEREWTLRARANAQLLSAAPDLLHAVRLLLNVIASVPVGLPIEAYEAEQLAIAAVAKAEGRT